MSNTFLLIIMITAVAGVGGTGLGGLTGALIKKDSKKTVSLLLSFAAGVMIAVVCFDLITEAVFPNGRNGDSQLYITIIGILVGFLVVALLNYMIDRSTKHEIDHLDAHHPETADDLDELIHSDHLMAHEQQKSPLFMAGVIMATAIALHNLPEGMVIGAAYASGTSTASAISSGLLTAIVIGLHNVPEGMAVSVPLIAGGMNKTKAILITALSGLPTVIGAMIGYLLGSMGAIWLTLSLSFASGAMLYVVFGELLPESILMWKSKRPAFFVIMGILCGMLIIFA